VKLLFITWDGPATTYHETLFIPLLERARRPGDQVTLLQFSWGEEARVERLHEFAASRDMRFEHRLVPRGRELWKLPWTMLSGLLWLLAEVRSGRADVVLARSMLPGGMATLCRRFLRDRFVFIYDADGLSADERVEFSNWSSGGALYRFFRVLERTSVRAADVTITRTARATAILGDRAGADSGPFVVVVNGKDADEFHPGDRDERRRIRQQLGVPEAAPLLVYVGSLGPQYEPAFTLTTFGHLLDRRPDARLLVLTPAQNHDLVASLAAGLPEGRVLVREAPPPDVPRLLRAADLGLAFRTPSFSQQAVAPIKVAEYLLSGLPVAYSAGIGDLEDQLGTDVAIAVAGTDDGQARRVVDWFVDDVEPFREERRAAARRLGVERFSLEAGAAGYRRALGLSGVDA
jgi:glycosyltransferase involved in cell wall biosynthesis